MTTMMMMMINSGGGGWRVGFFFCVGTTRSELLPTTSWHQPYVAFLVKMEWVQDCHSFWGSYYFCFSNLWQARQRQGEDVVHGTGEVLFVDNEALAVHLFVDTAAWKFCWLRFQCASQRSICTMLFKSLPLFLIDWLATFACLVMFMVLLGTRHIVLIPKLVSDQSYVPGMLIFRQQRDSVGKKMLLWSFLGWCIIGCCSFCWFQN